MISVLASGGPDGIVALPLHRWGPVMSGPYQGPALPRIGVVVPVTSPAVLRNESGIVRIRRVP
jgi:hypothetical protein